MRQQIRGRAQRGILRSKVTIAFLPVTGTMATRPSTANAQDAITLTEVVEYSGKAYAVAKGLYDFYQSNFTWQDPVVTASMLNAAVKQLSDLMIGLASQTYVDQVQTAISDYNYAVACVGTGADCATKWQNFDQEAGLLLSTIATKIKSDPNYSHLLGIAYNLLVPVYLQSHPNGAKWGILATSSSLMEDFKQVGKKAFDINFLMVGASSITFPSSFTGKSPYPHTPNSSTTYDTRTKSQLFSYIKAADTHSCYGSDDVCVAYLQTDPTAQVAQRAMLTLYDMFKDSYSNFAHTADATQTSVIVDLAVSYQHNWQDYNNAVWTAMFPPTSTAEAALNRCQDGSAVVGIWSNPKNWNMAFLCQSIPRLSCLDYRDFHATRAELESIMRCWWPL